MFAEYRNKRIRLNLKLSIKKRDTERLKLAVDDFKSSELSDEDMDIPKAEHILCEFQAKDCKSICILKVHGQLKTMIYVINVFICHLINVRNIQIALV